MSGLNIFSLSLSQLALARLLIPHQSEQRVDWQPEELHPDQLQQIVSYLCVQLESTWGAATGGRYCIVGSEDPLTVLLSCFAVWRSGGVVVLPNNLLEQTLDELRASDFERSSDFKNNSNAIHHPLLSDLDFSRGLHDKGAAKPRQFRPRESLSEDDNAVICFTSGSTGKPQAYSKNAGQVLGEARLLAKLFMVDLGGPVACSVPAYHLYGLLFACLAPLFAKLPLLGALRSVDRSPGPSPSLRNLVRLGRASALVTVPAHLQTLLGTDPQLLSEVRQVFSSAAPLSPSIGTQLLNLGTAPMLVEAFGSTETGGIATRTNDPGGPWVPLPGVEVTNNAEGRLEVRSPFAPVPADEPYLTADKISLCPSGFVHLGREDGVIKVGGKRIALQDLERCALEHPEVEDACCLTLSSGGIRNHLIGLAVSTHSPHFNQQELLRHLAKRFDEVVLPRRIRVLDLLPRSKTGKIQRHELLNLFTSANMRPPASDFTHSLMTHLKEAGFVNIVVAPRDSAEVQPQVSFELSTSAEQLWFQGHFRNAPVLPGIVQLRTVVLHGSLIAWPTLGTLRSITKVKFKRPIIPADRLRATLRLNESKNCVSFSILWLTNDAAQGSPLQSLLPQVFASPTLSEASSGFLSFEKVL